MTTSPVKVKYFTRRNGLILSSGCLISKTKVPDISLVAKNEFRAYRGRIYSIDMKLLAEMPKIATCLKCLKLRYACGESILIKKTQAVLLYSLTDVWFLMHKIPGIYIRDGANPAGAGHNFRHFSALQALYDCRITVFINNLKLFLLSLTCRSRYKSKV